ncbi:MAG TPA: ATP-binding protein, partial [Chitinophagaceae bacterium]|nr:ATP-binding protein [Chitinophagaceae bacterium]
YAINSLYAQVEISNGHILTASGVLDPNKAANIPVPGLYDQPGLLRSSDGYIWYSNYNYLKKIDTGLRKPVTVQYLDGWLMGITEMANKDILGCTANKLFRVRGKDFTVLLDNPALLQKASIQVISEVHPNDIWIGTGAGLFSYDLINNTLSRVGLPAASVRAIHKASDGSIWIGTYGQGFYRYDGQRFIKMPPDTRNYLATTHCFMEDKQGYFWLSTNKGLFRVAKKELDSYAAGNRNNVFYYYFDKSSGFTTNEFNGGCTPCGIVTRDGHFSLPSLDGLIQFNPDSIFIMPPNHPVFIDRIVMNRKQVSAGGHIEEKQDAGPLTFAISSPYFGNPANLHLEYSIPELDNKWNTVNDDGKLVLTGLHKGQYTLNVRKQERYGLYSYQTIRWTILPYWYETIWFRLLIAVMVIGALSLIFWVRFNQQVKRAQLLEQKVTERTQALSESNAVKQKMIAIILHDLRSPLRFLHILAAHIAENYQKTSASELADLLVKFRNATLDLNKFAQDFLVWTNAQKEGFVVRQERIALYQIIEEIVSLYEPATNISNNTVLNQVPAFITLVSDPDILKLIIRNLVDNANKYTMAGEIKMEALQDNANIRIIITDTGKSMEKELVAKIVSNAYQSQDAGHGIGYRIIFELLGKINGKLAIDSPGDTGNRITLTFPEDGKYGML